MNKNKGFTLAEMVAVIAIISFLALLSVPFVKGYVDDAYNTKAILHMKEINEARMNFEKDYPGTTISDNGGVFISGDCNVSTIYNSTKTLIFNKYSLVTCGYLRSTDLETRYTFTVGKDAASCEACEKAKVTAVISMLGNKHAGLYEGLCACIDSYGRIYRQAPDNGD